MKKKIGILTYLYAINHGSLHQANAILRFVQDEYPDYDVRFVNLAPSRGVLKELRNNLINKRPISGIKVVIKFYLSLRKMPFYGKRKITDSLVKSVEFIENLNLDLLIIGSDTVWESRMTKKGYAPKPPNIYFHGQYSRTRVISFAASSDRSLPEYWSEEGKNFVVSNLSKFDAISVRDRFTKSMLSSWSANTKIHLVGDPTFLVSHDYLHSFPYLPLAHTKYAVLDLTSRETSKYYADIFRSLGFIVVAPMTNRYADLNLRGKIDYLQWGWLHMHAACVVTNRFHGTIFSIIGKTSFISVDDSIEYTLGANSKKVDLLSRLGLSDRLVQSDFRDTNEIEKLLSEGSLIVEYKIYKEQWKEFLTSVKL